MDICNSSSNHRHSQQQPLRGYLRSPSYPQPYSGPADCSSNLAAPSRGQRVRLYIIDLQLATAGRGCADWLHVFDGLKSITLCGRRERSCLATSAKQQLQIRFHSNKQHRLKGFWLYYEGTHVTNNDWINEIMECNVWKKNEILNNWDIFYFTYQYLFSLMFSASFNFSCIFIIYIVAANDCCQVLGIFFSG